MDKDGTANAARDTHPETVRIVVTGSECTGKTTLAHDLAAAYGVECVPEFVRDFVNTIGGRPQFSDHGPIARGQTCPSPNRARRGDESRRGEPTVLQRQTA